MSAYLRVMTVQPSDRETLPHPNLQEVHASSGVGVRTNPRDPIAQQMVQPSQCSGPLAVRGYGVPLQMKD
jgi:hypothetical protein